MQGKEATIQLPAQLSTLAPEVDWLYYFIYWVSVIFFVGIVGVMMYFALKYRRRSKTDRPEAMGDHTMLEIFWTASPILLLIPLFFWGFEGYVKASVAPEDAIDVRVRGSQWNWEFEYENGMISGEVFEDEQGNKHPVLVVPEKRPVRLIMSSSDVLHSFYVPAFRIKKDVVPGMYSTAWFEATKKGMVQVFCTEYCGAPEGKDGNQGHSNMLGKVRVVDQKEFDKFLAEGPKMPDECEGDPACWGKILYENKQCGTCHGVDGVSQQPAPNFKGLWGRMETMSDGKVIKVDENYVRESILMPQAKIVKGYEGVLMSLYRFSDNEVDALIAYIKSLK